MIPLAPTQAEENEFAAFLDHLAHLLERGVVTDVDPWPGNGEHVSREAGTDGHLYRYGSTQLDLPDEQAAWVRRVAASIADEHLAADGREDQPHITVLYGLQDLDFATMFALVDICGRTPPLTVTLGAVQQFAATETSQDYAVLILPVQSADLHLLHAQIAAAVPHTETHPVYQPHLTLAYVQPDAARWYLGMDPFQGTELRLDTLTVSDRDGKTTHIPFTGKPE